MQSTFFWRNWPSQHRSLWFIFSGLFVISLVLLAYTAYLGPSGVINWETVQDQKVVETMVHTFRLGPFQLQIPGESYVIFEYLEGSHVFHNQFISLAFLTVLALGALVIITVISTLPRFWYYLGIALFIFFLLALRVEVLVLFGIRGYAIPIIFALGFVILSFYFKSFRPYATFRGRLTAFSGLAIAWAIIIFGFSEIPHPFLHLVANAYLPALILTALFILMVAHEILASFVYIAGQGTSKGLRHFLLISTIYMVNILITCLHEMNVIQWNFIYINLYLLFAISAILGVWGFRVREPLYESIVSFRPGGALFYLVLGSISVMTIAQFLGNNNDAALKIVRDVIIFSHAGYGIIFLTYIFSNFLAMMDESLPVYRLLYKPNRMPYFTFQFAGLVATLAFVFYSGWRNYVYHGLAGFYTYVADLYVLQGRMDLAEDFFDESRKLAFRSHRANYALGSMKTSRFDFDRAHYHYDLANAGTPSIYSLTNKSNLYFWEKEYYHAIGSLRSQLKIMPGSGVLENNLAYAYSKVKALDSAAWFIGQAREHRLTKASAEGNFLALAAMESIPVQTDSLLEMFDTSGPTVAANALALSTLLEQDVNLGVDPLADTILNLYSATLLNNYIIRHAETVDTAFVSKAYAIAADSMNQYYSEALKASLAHAYYLQGNVTRALEILAELAYTSYDYGGKYNYIMGLFALHQGNPEVASSFFTHAETAHYKDSRFYNAIALTEAGNTNAALAAWDSVARSGDASQQEIARRIRAILTLPAHEVPRLSDMEKYQFCRYRINVADTTFFNRLSNEFYGAEYKAQALLDMSMKQFRAGNLATAIHYLNRISGLELRDRRLFEDVRHAELLILAWKRDVRLLASQINQGIEFGPDRYLEKCLYTALLHEANGEFDEARELYKIVGRWNPYFEEGIIAAANFFRQQAPESLQAYNLLAEALHVNYNGFRLLEAYEQEATRLGFDAYADSARQRLEELRGKR